ncbi:MAG: 23S rRNA (adenine(2503)-C(2))-methyltransferase RlmN [Candidatus Margulisbacteria bacterium]|nr:23S rRNA (adenine(2503)-C(2))-methyltransferase RlmN [Candidatus Margulisiibacteriota bacterium]
MNDLSSKSIAEITALCNELGLPQYKAREIFRFINQKLVENINEITTLKKEERSFFTISAIPPVKIEKGKTAEKALFTLNDGSQIETVYMDYADERKSLCVSSQVGCPMGCKFCATGRMGFIRNLTAAEILAQVYYFAKKEKISNLVFMGMGEPFLNYENVMKAIYILNDDLGLNIASRKIVISTIGLIPGIKKFTDETKQIRLAWSLVAPTDELRKKLIGCKGLPTIADTIKALRDYQRKRKRRITIEYVLLKHINDSEQNLRDFAKIAHKLDSHINLIPYNLSPASQFQRVDPRFARDFLKSLGCNVTVRQSLGQEISAACGQLCQISY